MTARNMDSFTPLIVVVDRSNAGLKADEIAVLGGAWETMFGLWRKNHYPYLIMLAHTVERFRRRAPLVMMAQDEEALRLSVKKACSELSGRARWNLFIEKDGVADLIIQRELLADWLTEGTA